MKNKKNAPYIISSKDLDYLKDIFSWNYNAFKINKNLINNLKDKDIIKFFNNCNNFFNDNMIKILNILNGSDCNE